MAITLGKDATIQVDGALFGVRDVTISQSARTIDIEEYGIRNNAAYSTGFDTSLSMELNDDRSVGAIITAMRTGNAVTVQGGQGNWVFDAVITGISERAALDGVVTFQIEARMTKPGLRAE